MAKLQAPLLRKIYFIEKIGLQEHLSPTRANGLLEMVKRMKMDAIKNI